MDSLGLPARIQTILQTMVDYPETRSHLLMIGPPGSGKTTSAKFFVQALHGTESSNTLTASNSLFGRALFLNSSDERGLEAVRSRVYPFIRSSFSALFQTKHNAPKVIVFDEAETLTDQAQIALRPLLDRDPRDVMILFLCNSISRIHASISHKFLTIPYEAPQTDDFQFRMQRILNQSRAQMTGLDIEFRRGDIRFFLLNPGRFQDCAKLWHELFNLHITELSGFFEKTLPRWTFPDLAMFCIFCANKTGTLDRVALVDMLQLSDTDFAKQCSPSLRSRLLADWYIQHVRLKLEAVAIGPTS